MPRHAMLAILAALCIASFAAPVIAAPAPTDEIGAPTDKIVFGTPKSSPPRPAARDRAPRNSIHDARVFRLRRMRKKDKKKNAKKNGSLLDLSLDLYPITGSGEVKLGGEHDVSSVGTRIKLTEELAHGGVGTVMGGTYATPDGRQHKIAVKRMLRASPGELLTAALRECSAGLNAGPETGVLPCYGIVVGPNLLKEVMAARLESHADAQDSFHRVTPPLVTGRWSDKKDRWTVGLLMPWVEGAVNGQDFADDSLFDPTKTTTKSEAAAATPASSLHAALTDHNNWDLVPGAIIACVTRAAQYLLSTNTWHRNIKASNMIFTPDFAVRPLDSGNCLLIGFASAHNLEKGTGELHWKPGGDFFLHPQAFDFYPKVSFSLHHALDLFDLVRAASQLILGGEGHPLLRCLNEDALIGASLLFTSIKETAADERHQLATRIAGLSEDDIRDVALVKGSLCDDIGVLFPPGLGEVVEEKEEKEKDRTRSAFMKRAALYQWGPDPPDRLGHAPELADLARLFRLSTSRPSGGKNSPVFSQVYDDMLRMAGGRRRKSEKAVEKTVAAPAEATEVNPLAAEEEEHPFAETKKNKGAQKKKSKKTNKKSKK